MPLVAEYSDSLWTRHVWGCFVNLSDSEAEQFTDSVSPIQNANSQASFVNLSDWLVKKNQFIRFICSNQTPAVFMQLEKTGMYSKH